MNEKNKIKWIVIDGSPESYPSNGQQVIAVDCLGNQQSCIFDAINRNYN